MAARDCTPSYRGWGVQCEDGGSTVLEAVTKSIPLFLSFVAGEMLLSRSLGAERCCWWEGDRREQQRK
jgi:hypothetical protein